jgi:hypothetical protein
VGVGIGERITDGRLTGETALKLYVRRKLPKRQLTAIHRLPTAYRGLPIDVEEIGQIRPLLDTADPRAIRTPAQPGCSVGFEYPGNQQFMAGTIGALVRDSAKDLCILSNSHVLAFEGKLPLGSPIYQCGLLDLPTGAQPRQIASLSQFAPLNVPNLRVDAAIAKLTSPGLAVPEILGIGKPKGTATAQANMSVHKMGRTTGYSVGLVMNTDTNITVDYDTGSYTFFDQIIISSQDGSVFCDTGDSGALVVDRASGNAVGLLCAASATHGIVNHIEFVMSALNVKLA